ncbi:DNA mismatch repair protein MutS [Lachnospiraceae bacterium]|uniref:MutS-related protein n=1 Tax=Extibacter sp. GGCC_0201 TaxID=2731209 RepID=UPI001AA1700D|nr:hypothetical protein [Extibacter sp. GGCC_0201]MBO1722326.1 hypothetical protein [Extibacter sp. GGCC_0201]BDF32807.1 DNA mismatch repair protein MutS [Lachnospiraceae bacterium]BDF36812.1 DNA mismatch repair protein MutS [Lachnospiraceae bacterium]
MDVYTLALVAGAIVSIFIIAVWSRYAGQKRVRDSIRKQYGKKPDRKEMDFQLTGQYFAEAEHKDTDGLVDDETWNDLDMSEVFQRLNATCSFAGEQYLYASLRILSQDEEKFSKYERRMSYFEENPKEREEIQFELYKIGKRPSYYYLPSFFNNIDAFKMSRVTFYRVMQAAILASLLLCLVLRTKWILIATFCLFLINIVIHGLMKGEYDTQLEVIEGIYGLMQVMRKLTGSRAGEFGEEFKEFYHIAADLKDSEKKFSYLLGRKRASATGDFMEVAATYITGAFLLDCTMYNKIIREIEERIDTFIWLYELVGELDMLISIASFRKSLPAYCLPDFHEELSIEMEDIYHPLIDNPVYNSVRLHKNTIITGSNASGKSTFIKAAAINEIFAQTIHTCTARRFVLPPTYVKSSMAVRDNLMAGESYYIREIKSLKRTALSTDGRLPVFCAIDEILRGTNTDERLAASASILRYLQDKNCIVLVATHDLELLDMLKDSGYDNYYFSEQPEAEDVIFDYKIHSGVSKNTNAIRLLERIGFPEEVIGCANHFYQQIIVTKSQK